MLEGVDTDRVRLRINMQDIHRPQRAEHQEAGDYRPNRHRSHAHKLRAEGIQSAAI